MVSHIHWSDRLGLQHHPEIVRKEIVVGGVTAPRCIRVHVPNAGWSGQSTHGHGADAQPAEAPNPLAQRRNPTTWLRMATPGGGGLDI